MEPSPSDGLGRLLLERKKLLLSKRAAKLKKVTNSHSDTTLPVAPIQPADEETKRTKRSNRSKKLAKRESVRRKRDLEDVVTRSGIIYLGHIPHGFFEQEMRHYFSQFGRVQSVRLSRSHRTGRSRGYAFVKFRCDEVAKVAAETMNNYLMYNRLVKCQVVSGHRNMFRRGKHWRSQREREDVMKQRYDKLHSVSSMQKYRKRIRNVVAKENKLKNKLRERGYCFDYPSVTELVESKSLDVIPSHKKFYNPESDRSDTECEM